MRKSIRNTLAALALTSLAGCASTPSQEPQNISPSTYSEKETKVLLKRCEPVRRVVHDVKALTPIEKEKGLGNKTWRTYVLDFLTTPENFDNNGPDNDFDLAVIADFPPEKTFEVYEKLVKSNGVRIRGIYATPGFYDILKNSNAIPLETLQEYLPIKDISEITPKEFSLWTIPTDFPDSYHRTQPKMPSSDPILREKLRKLYETD